ncbi:hypothetical protein RhiirA5_500741 [Rhizophagus irregularis]|uniref:Uncharacterized protein n=1 Tax=Rhizophagus irregularis TaxID=588596 RepID=A0A2N0PKG7_9GLOM|nr:hypothetical protein RhiirA5_500741 [Rhizophagus irregularis]
MTPKVIIAKVTKYNFMELISELMKVIKLLGVDLDLWMHLHRIPKVKISTLKFIMKEFQDNEFKDSVLKSGLKFYHPTIIVLMGTPISHKMECLKERLRKLHQSQAQTALIGLVLWKNFVYQYLLINLTMEDEVLSKIRYPEYWKNSHAYWEADSWNGKVFNSIFDANNENVKR